MTTNHHISNSLALLIWYRSRISEFSLVLCMNAGTSPHSICIWWLTYLSDSQILSYLYICYKVICYVLHVMCSKLLGVTSIYITIYALGVTPKAIACNGGEAMTIFQSNN